MAAKLLHSLTDDNPDMQKQIGCMTGVFQIFDRHHVVAGRRRITAGHSPKRPPPGNSQFNNETPERESSNVYQRPQVVDKHSNKIIQDKHRASTESSKDSFSSLSRSSSFSSVDCSINRTTHPESDHIVFPETPSRDPVTRQSCISQQLGRQSLDLRDMVKDSMYREARGSSHKSATKDESPDLMMDYRDSLNALSELKETNWYCDEPREFSRSKSYQFKDMSSFSVSKDYPRFSYDGRETNGLSFESRENAKRTVPKQPKELPRLSLDSREGSMRSLNPFSLVPNKASDLKSNLLSRNPKSDSIPSADRGQIQTRPPSVVAKLMGLETLPDSASASNKKLGVEPIITHPAEDLISLSNSSKATDVFGPIKIPNSSRSSLKEPTSPCWKNTDLKPISRFPIEPTPWKQWDGARSPQKSAYRVIKSPNKMHSPFSSVYCEVDKRLKHLEFTQSGKDLRALKHILEAMQSIEARKEGRQDMVERYSIATQSGRFSDHGRSPIHHQNSSSPTRSNYSAAYESPIVIMKPAKLVERSGIDASAVIHVDDFLDNTKSFTNNKVGKDLNPRITRRQNAINATDVKAGARHTRPAQTSTGHQQLTKENTACTGKILGSVSPRLQQKRVDVERQSRPPMPPTDSNKLRKQPNKQHSESTSPGGRRRPKNSNIQQTDDQYCEISSESRKIGYRETQVSQQLNRDIVPKIDTDVGASECSEEFGNSQSPSSTQEKSILPMRTDKLLALEYQSPVSVLDDAVYKEDSPSPVKHMPKTQKDDATQSPNEDFIKDEWDSADEIISNTFSSGVTCEINRKKLQNIEHLVQKLRRLNSSHDETHTDYIASLCENTKPEDRYISEILLASGLLLRDLGSNLTNFQFHSSGHPVNPELFLVLEQTKFSNLPKEDPPKPEKLLKNEKFHRKLIFDTVNEILAGKLALVIPSLETWSKRGSNLSKKTLNAQKLLRDLCSEIEQLQVKKNDRSSSLDEEDDGLKSILWEDVLNRAESWTDYGGEPVIALEVERLIFKDLVNEVVLGEALDGRRATQSPSPTTRRRCRKLFSK